MAIDDITTVIWDYDNNIEDTSHANYGITRKITEILTDKSADGFPALSTYEAYFNSMDGYGHDWRNFWIEEIGLTQEQTDMVRGYWNKFQITDAPPFRPFDGIPEVIKAIQIFPQGVVSASAKEKIWKSFGEGGLQDYFGYIVGNEEVHIRRQKPFPDGYIKCLNGLTGLKEGIALYIGDGEVDVLTVNNANAVLNGQGINVLSIGTRFRQQENNWQVEPDYWADKPEDIVIAVQDINPKLKLDNGGVLVRT